MYKYTAIIVEPRKHKAIQFVLRNILKCLDDQWQVIFFGGNNNSDYLHGIKNKINSSRLKIKNINLPKTLGLQEYSRILCDAEFYKHIPTETFLVFQLDSMINFKNKRYIYDYLEYDYVGAPWDKQPRGGVGNGGFSLRKKSKMLEIIEKIPYDGKLNEDRYFSLFMGYHSGYTKKQQAKWQKEINLKKPTTDLAKKFSVETVFSKDFFAIHKPWLYLKSSELNIIYDECDVMALKNLQ